LIDKPAGPTSHDVIDMIRRALAVRRAGHTGTLDPFATGLLVVLVGRATRLAQFLSGLSKRYTGIIRLGTTTDTLDSTGAVTATSDAWRLLDDARIRREMAALTGLQQQRPPAYSARKVGGVPAYRKARRGEPADLDAREVVVHAFDWVARTEGDVAFEADVSSGTYVRSLAADLGERLGCGAHLAALRRTGVGDWRVEDAVAPALVSADHLRSPRSAVRHLETVELSEDELVAVGHGRTIERAGVAAGPVALIRNDDLIAVADATDDRLAPRVVLAP
jgi:tRNA pseudouridine55 synthase